MKFLTSNRLPILAALLFFLTFISTCNSSDTQRENRVESTKSVTIYTHHVFESDSLLFQRFEKLTGIKVNVLEASVNDLVNRLEAEGADSPADVFIAVGEGRLFDLKSKDYFQPFSSTLIEQHVPSRYQDRQSYWVGLSKRPGIIAYAKDRVNPEAISSYQALADEKWKGRILARSSRDIYLQSLIANMILNDGEEATQLWANHIVQNLARKPKGNNRDQILSIAKGEGDVAIVNTHNIGSMLNSEDPEERAAAEKVGIIFPDSGSGTPVNLRGVALLKNARNRANAIQLIEFLTSQEAQNTLAANEFEYPVNPTVIPSSVLLSWGVFQEAETNLNLLGEQFKRVPIILEAAGWE